MIKLKNVLRLRVCCIMTPEVSKCCLKYKNRGVTRGFYIPNYISTPTRLLYNKFVNKNIILIAQSVEYQVDVHPLGESKNVSVCNRFRAHPLSLIICRQSVIYFPCMYVWNKIHTCLYAILEIVFYDQISIIAFLSRTINSVLKIDRALLGRASLAF
jgi:hypothetical protein